jgi:hypothetical protein
MKRRVGCVRSLKREGIMGWKYLQRIAVEDHLGVETVITL